MILISFLLFSHVDVDLEQLYQTATTRLVNFSAAKDSAMQEFVLLGTDSLTSDTTIRFLVSKFDTKSSVERQTLKDILKDIGPRAIKWIVRGLDGRGSDDEARSLKESLWILGEIGGVHIVEPVAPYINDSAWAVRSAAFTALGQSKSYEAINYVIKGLVDSIALVRKSSYYALSELATEREMPFLLTGLSDEFYGVRYAALSGIRRLGACEFLIFEHLGGSETNDYFYVAAMAGSEVEHLFDDRFWPTSPSTRKAMYEILPARALQRALNKESHPLLKAFLTRRLGRVQ
jgi:HEAT repeat protein